MTYGAIELRRRIYMASLRLSRLPQTSKTLGEVLRIPAEQSLAVMGKPCLELTEEDHAALYHAGFVELAYIRSLRMGLAHVAAHPKDGMLGICSLLQEYAEFQAGAAMWDCFETWPFRRRDSGWHISPVPGDFFREAREGRLWKGKSGVYREDLLRHMLECCSSTVSFYDYLATKGNINAHSA